MGYYANGSGSATFALPLSDDKVKKLEGILNEYGFETDGDARYLNFWCYDKYHDDEVEAALKEILKIAELAEGCVEYCGEDDAHWRFWYSPGQRRWCVQSGHVIYDDKPDYWI